MGQAGVQRPSLATTGRQVAHSTAICMITQGDNCSGPRGGALPHTFVVLNSPLPPPLACSLQTVCTYWLRNLCMKGDTCGFLHQFDPERMPVCRNLLKFGVCKEPDCPYKHSTEEIKECNMYKLGFCVYGPAVGPSTRIFTFICMPCCLHPLAHPPPFMFLLFSVFAVPLQAHAATWPRP